MPDADKKQKNDLFAQIAASRGEYRERNLVEPGPPALSDVCLPLTSDSSAAFSPMLRIDTPAKLKRELARYRKSHARFLKNFAPQLESQRITCPLENFDWRIETPADLADFTSTLAGGGDWEQVRIPHYGPPLGKAVTYYRTTFDVTQDMLANGSLFVCFKGVDYKAHVFVNGAYLGSHEGFFAPFEFDFTPVARLGPNTLLLKVENDAICMSNDSWGDDGQLYEGDKVYAATGPGYDEPTVGWHHCPPAMGIYQCAYVEARSRVFVSDVFVRPVLEESRAECWVEVYNCGRLREDVRLRLSVYGRNFRARVVQDMEFDLPGPAGPGVNYFRLPFDVPSPRLWDIENPWLYQAQVYLMDANGELLDISERQFGMRSFKMDEDSEPKGRFFLNGREVCLRGANTMGFEQLDVMSGDWDQLIDDILLAKICNMNFLRLTQRPVQEEVYDYCDRLGLMTQTDLPLFGVLRRNQFCEAVRQAEEMERLVRSHPCNILASYINEPFPGAWGKPHRHLTRPELDSFFTAATEAVRLANPDRVIKPVDGDYDPPAPGLPDNHCYNGWYNGHGLDIGKLHRGYWQSVKPGWFYGCGEFGAEGLDPVETMRKHYPPEWLPHTPEEERGWTPNAIPQAQTGRFHYMWFDTQRSLENWVMESQEHQARVVRLMTEAFRRDDRMNSFAVHLFIDAFPSGWMKSIMDVGRNPKPAYFAYRDALTPLMVSLRSDRSAYAYGEQVDIEAWMCNDTNSSRTDLQLHYQVECEGQVVLSGKTEAQAPACGSAFQGHIRFAARSVCRRARMTIRLGLLSSDGVVLHDTQLPVEVFPPVSGISAGRRACIIGAESDIARRLAGELGLVASDIGSADVILIDDYSAYSERRESVDRAVENGSSAVFLELPKGDCEVCGSCVKVTSCGMGDRHFVSRDTGHRLVEGFCPRDFSFWFDADEGRITPILGATFDADGWDAILTAGNGDWSTGWAPSLVAAERRCGRGRVTICQLRLAGRVNHNPVARIFAGRLLG